MRLLRTLLILLVLSTPGVSLARTIVFQSVPLVELLAHPEAHHGQNVRVHGFIVLEFEGNTLWRSEADFRANRYDRAVWLSTEQGHFDEHPLNGKKAYVSGRFDAKSYGHLGLTNSTITEVTLITADTTDTDRGRPWRNDPMFLLLASLGMLGLFMGLTSFGLRGLRAHV